jgi:hypothetical protein
MRNNHEVDDFGSELYANTDAVNKSLASEPIVLYTAKPLPTRSNLATFLANDEKIYYDRRGFYGQIPDRQLQWDYGAKQTLEGAVFINGLGGVVGQPYVTPPLGTSIQDDDVDYENLT